MEANYLANRENKVEEFYSINRAKKMFFINSRNKQKWLAINLHPEGVRNEKSKKFKSKLWVKLLAEIRQTSFRESANFYANVGVLQLSSFISRKLKKF